MPTLPAAKKAVFALLPEKVEGDIYELGAGWGNLAFSLAKRYPQNQIVAYELSPVPYLVCVLRKKLGGTKNLILKREDFLKADLSQAKWAVVYLYPGAMLKLSQKLTAGTGVVSNTFFLPGRKASRTIKLNDLFMTTIFLYPPA